MSRVLVIMKDKIFNYRKTAAGYEVWLKGQLLGHVYKTRDYTGDCWGARNLNCENMKDGKLTATYLIREDAATALLPKRDWSWAHKYAFGGADRMPN